MTRTVRLMAFLLLGAAGTAELCGEAEETLNGRPLRIVREAQAEEFAPWEAPPFYLSSAPARLPGFITDPADMERPLVQQYLRQYSSEGGLAWLAAVMDQGSYCLAFIRREIARRDLPRELIFLPVIESGYLSSAMSRSGATGLWQFMKNSIAPFNIKVTDWVDERMDFWKSTEGALDKLKENYSLLGDWYLALAAYNAGYGAVSGAVKRTGIRDYWALSEMKAFKTETIHYVPKLLAVSYILSNPRLFGLDLSWNDDPRWRRIPVDRQVDLKLLAKESGADAELLRKANRELIHHITPPGHLLKIPEGDAGAVEAVLARKDLPLITYYRHVIKSGDTLLALGRHYGVSFETILDANPGTKERALQLGKVLLIPALKDAGPYLRPGEEEQRAFDGTHLVKKGETLWSIALSCGIDPEALAEANGMTLSSVLPEGKILKTPSR